MMHVESDVGRRIENSVTSRLEPTPPFMPVPLLGEHISIVTSSTSKKFERAVSADMGRFWTI
jgi:hypothetical protein